MGALHRVATWLGLNRDAVTAPPPAGVTPPTRKPAAGFMSDREASVVPSVFRALSILVAGAEQLTIDVSRNGRPAPRVPSIVRRPAQDLRFDEWTTQLMIDLALDGNAFVRKVRANGEILDLPILPADQVHVGRHAVTGRIQYHHQGNVYSTDDVEHIYLVKRASWLRGISPIEAARRGLSFTSGAADYAAGWFSHGQPAGILSSEQTLNADQARAYRDIWNEDNRAENPSGIKVLGKGLTYEPILLKPADVLWLEAQDATTTDIARIFGIPATLMLIGIEGSATTYANISQEWLGFARFTLMLYLRPIEQLLTEVLGTGFDARFNLDGLLRPDTKSRYEAHAIALAGNWLTIDEVRAIEGLGPLPAALPAPKDSHA